MRADCEIHRPFLAGLSPASGAESREQGADNTLLTQPKNMICFGGIA